MVSNWNLLAPAWLLPMAKKVEGIIHSQKPLLCFHICWLWKTLHQSKAPIAANKAFNLFPRLMWIQTYWGTSVNQKSKYFLYPQRLLLCWLFFHHFTHVCYASGTSILDHSLFPQLTIIHVHQVSMDLSRQSFKKQTLEQPAWIFSAHVIWQKGEHCIQQSQHCTHTLVAHCECVQQPLLEGGVGVCCVKTTHRSLCLPPPQAKLTPHVDVWSALS